MRQLSPLLPYLLFLVLPAGCIIGTGAPSSELSIRDGGLPEGTRPDGSLARGEDSGSETTGGMDASRPTDASLVADSGGSRDAGSVWDAGSPRDAGASPDSGSPLSDQELSRESGGLVGCYFNGIPLWGEVQVVDSWPDIEVRIVSSFADLRVQWVDNWPDECGEWEMVDRWPDFTIRYVRSFPDIEIQEVDHWPGL